MAEQSRLECTLCFLLACFRRNDDRSLLASDEITIVSAFKRVLEIILDEIIGIGISIEEERAVGMLCADEDDPATFVNADFFFARRTDIFESIPECQEYLRASERTHFRFTDDKENAISERNERADTITDPLFGYKMVSKKISALIDSESIRITRKIGIIADKGIESAIAEGIIRIIDSVERFFGKVRERNTGWEEKTPVRTFECHLESIWESRFFFQRKRNIGQGKFPDGTGSSDEHFVLCDFSIGRRNILIGMWIEERILARTRCAKIEGKSQCREKCLHEEETGASNEEDIQKHASYAVRTLEMRRNSERKLEHFSLFGISNCAFP